MSFIPCMGTEKERLVCLPGASSMCVAMELPRTQGNLGVPTKVQVSWVEKLPTPQLQAQVHAA